MSTPVPGEVCPRRFLILGNGTKPGAEEAAVELRGVLEQQDREVVGFDLSGRVDFGHHDADMAIVLGGDGAILRAAHQMGSRQVPVLGVNLGHLGFLAELSPDEFCSHVPRLLRAEYVVSRHVHLDVHLHKQASDAVLRYRALNEVTIMAGPPFRITDFELTIDGMPVATFSGDGVILSTPIGSTAHNLAAGGPILNQVLPAVVITPICPHALTWRPLVESADRRFQVRVPNASEGTTMIVDGYLQERIGDGDRVEIQRSPVDFQLVRLQGRNYYTTLTNKLHWGARLRQ